MRQEHRVEGAAELWRSGEAKEGENYVRSAKSWHVANDFGVVTARPTLAVTSFLLSLSLFSLFVCQGKAGQRSARARGKLSEAKTQRRPHSAEKKSEIVEGFSFVVLLFFVSFV